MPQATTNGGRGGVTAGLWIRGAVFTVAVPMGLGFAIPLLLPHHTRTFTWAWCAAWPLIGTGIVFYGFCLLRFLRAGGTPAIFFTQTIGSIIGREPGVFVSGGLYRITRNPMYVGVVLAVLGQALLYRSISVAVYGALLWMFFHFTVVLGEEPHLRARYGDPYVEYCRGVPRWLW